MPDAQFTVPYPEHNHFVGREDDLQRLHAALQGEGPVGINPAALGNPTGVTGQGGIGKTQLAVAYAYRYRQHYPDGVYWLNAAESLWSEFANLGRHFLRQGGEGALRTRLYETLRVRFKVEEIRDLCFELGINYEEFSPQLGLSSLARELVAHCERRGQLGLLEAAVRRQRGDLAEPQAQDELIAHAFTHLRQRRHSLLILDNLADPAALDESVIRDCVPCRLPGRLLFTTRRRDLGRFQPVELKTLPPDAALRLLLRDPRRQPALDPTHPEHTTARDICATFGYLPLALEIAAAHLAKYSTAPLAAYRDELRRRGARDVMADRHVTVETRHKTGLDAALEAQWATLGEEAQTLLRVAGQLPEAAYLPVARLGLLAGVPEEGQSFFDVTLAGALDELNSASLIEELAGDEVRLHPLVREFAHDRTPNVEKEDFCGTCVRQLLTALSNIKTLERQCDQRGIDALIYDLLAAQSLLYDVGPYAVAGHVDLWSYLTVFRREAHNLRGWRRENAPAFLAQQLHNRLIRNELPMLFGDLSTYLRQQGPTWKVKWTTRRESTALEVTLTNCKDFALVTALTPDGQQIVSGEWDGTLRVSDIFTGRENWAQTGHEGRIIAVAVMPDGSQVVSVGEDGRMKVWDLLTGLLLRTLIGPEVRAAVIIPDGRRILSCGRGILRLWDLVTGHKERILTGAGKVVALATTMDGKWAVSGSEDGLIRVWNLTIGQETGILFAHLGCVRSVALTSDGRQVISGGDDGIILIWNLVTGQEKRLIGEYVTSILAVALTQDEQQVVAATAHGAIDIWDLSTGHMVQTIAAHEGKVLSVAVTPDGQQVVSSGSDLTLKVWRLEEVQTERALGGHQATVGAIVMTHDGQRAISGGFDHTLRIWNLATGLEEQVLNGVGKVIALASAPDGQHVYCGTNKTLRVLDLTTKKEKRMLFGRKGRINAVVVAPDGCRVISGGSSQLQVWDTTSGQVDRTLAERKFGYRTVTLTPNGRHVISVGHDDGLYIWDLDTGEEGGFSGHSDGVEAVTVTPDGRTAISCAWDGALHIWDLHAKREEQVLNGHEGWVSAVGATPVGRQVISGGHDRTLRVWDLDKGHELARISLDTSLTCLAVAPGQPVVSGIVCNQKSTTV